MEIEIGDDTDDETARAIATAVSEHLGRSVEIVHDGERVADAGETDWTEAGAVLTDREENLRKQIEGIHSGGPKRGHEKIEGLEKVFDSRNERRDAQTVHRERKGRVRHVRRYRGAGVEHEN